MRISISNVLGSAADLAMVLICMAVIVPTAQRYLSRRAAADPVQSILTVGVRFAPLPGISYTDSRLTVAVFVNGRCVACQQSVPDYGRIRQAVGSTAGKVRLSGVIRRGGAEAATGHDGLGLGLPLIQVEDFRSYGVSGTPTVIVIDSSGRVKEFWVGKLSPNAINNLLRIVKEA